MKKKLLSLKLLFSLFALLFTGSLLAQEETLDIGDFEATASTVYSPASAFYRYSYTQTIYYQSELADLLGFEITGLEYRLTDGFSKNFNQDVEVYIGYTNQEEFEVTGSKPYDQDWIPLENLTLHYSGKFTCPAEKPFYMKVELDTPFLYDGSGNLVIAFVQSDRLADTQSSGFYGTRDANGKVRVLIAQSDNNAIDTSLPSTSSQSAGLVTSVIVPNTRFYYMDPGDRPVIMDISATGFDYDYIEIGKQATQSLTIYNRGSEALEITSIDHLAAPFAASQTTFTVPSSSNRQIDFTFSPTETGEFSQEISFVSNAENSPVAFSLKGMSYPSGSLLESFEEEMFPPNYWRSEKGIWEQVEDARHGTFGAKLDMQEDLLISPLVSGEFSLFAHNTGANPSLKIFASTDARTWEQLATEVPPSFFMEYTYTLPGQVYVAISGSRIVIDLVKAGQVKHFDKDLAIVSYTIPEETNETTYINIPVNIRNWGVSAETSYTLYLKNGETDEILATTNGQSIEPLEEKELKLEWSPQTDVNSLYIELVFTGDEDLTNNTTPVRDIYVIPSEVGELSFSSTNIDFGYIEYNEEKTYTITIRNTGNKLLTVEDITLNPPFSIDLTAGEQFEQGDEAKTYTITFAPTQAAGVYEEEMIIKHDGLRRSSTIMLKAEILEENRLYETFDGEVFPPYLWTIKGTTWDREAWSSSSSVPADPMAKMTNRHQYEDQRLITPKLNIQEGDELSFYLRRTHINGDDKLWLSVQISEDMQEWEEIKLFSGRENISTSPVRNTLTFDRTGEYYVSFSGIFELWINDVLGPLVIIPQKDIAARALTGPSFGSVSNEMIYTATLVNQSAVDESQYTIKLVNGDEVLVTKSGVNIPAFSVLDIPITWIPETEGEYKINVVVEMEGDENPDNNTLLSYEAIETKINPENVIQVQVGTTEFENPSDSYSSPDKKLNIQVPFAATWKYSFTEVMYYPEELNIPVGTEITSIGYKYYIETIANPETPINIWIGETELENFSETVVEPSSMSFAFESDRVTFQKGWFIQGELAKSNEYPVEIWIELETPYTYRGGNLVIGLETDRLDASSLSAISFYKNITTDLPNRTIRFISDTKGLDMTDLTTSIGNPNKENFYPTTLFKGTLPGIQIYGTVKDTDGSPVGGANLTLVSDEIVYETTSAGDGTFSFNIYNGDRDYVLSVEGEEKQTITVGQEDVNVGIVTVDAASDYCNFTVKVTTTTGTSLEGVPVFFENNYTGMSYSRTLSAEGTVEYNNILKGTYTLIIELDKHVSYINEELEISYTQTLEIELAEDIIEPYGVQAAVSYNEQTGKGIVDLSWNNDMDAFFDDFEDYDDFAISFFPWTGIDADGGIPVGMDISYPNSIQPQYAVIFNPMNTNPPRWGYPEMMPYSGYKCVMFTAVQNVVNNDWLIAPKKLIKRGDKVSFMAKALGVNYETEEFKVAVSTSGNTNTSDFTVISEGNNVSVGGNWTKFEYDLSRYEGQEIYIAVNYVSPFKQLMFLDDFYIGIPSSRSAARQARRVTTAVNEEPYPEYVVYIDGAETARTGDLYHTISGLDGGDYRIGVKAVYWTGETDIIYTDVHIDGATAFASIEANVSANNNKTVENLNVTFSNRDEGITYEKRVENGKISIPFAKKGEYYVSAQQEGYEDYGTAFTLTGDYTFDIVLEEITGVPYNLTISILQKGEETFDAEFRWNQELGFRDGFEEYEDFTDFQFEGSPWISLDLDEAVPYGMQMPDGQHIYYPGGSRRDDINPTIYGVSIPRVFNPSSTTPPCDYYYGTVAAEGNKYVLFASSSIAVDPETGSFIYPETDDWLISPKEYIGENYVLRFLLKAMPVAGIQDRSEEMRICISQDTEPETFVQLDLINPSNESWEQYEIDLSEYAGKNMHIGFNYISWDKFFVQLDDVYIGPATSNVAVGEPVGYEVYLDNVLQGTVTDNSFTFTGLDVNEKYTAGVKAIYVSGTTEMAEITFNSSGSDGINNQSTEGFKVYPTVVTQNSFTVESTSLVKRVRIFNMNGLLVKDIHPQPQQSMLIDTGMLPAGIYYVNVTTGTTTQSVKIVIAD